MFLGCHETLGVSKGLIKDSQFTASSSYDEHHQPYHARLNKTVKGSRGGWCSAFADETEFLEVDLGNKTAISGKESFSISLSLQKFRKSFKVLPGMVNYGDFKRRRELI